ncbi:MAG: DNA topoisomerase III [Rubripirellula sp.]
MPNTLIIAEKPSVATDLARVLGKLPGVGKFTKKKDYFENDFAYVTSAIGHLVELKMPEGPNGKKLPWGMKHLPVIPPQFELQPIEKSLSRYKLLARLLKKKEIDTVVNACDAGREGELIFRYLLQLAGLKEDVAIKRMWMQSMTDDSIIEAWNSMRDNDEMLPLADAALCRSESDWLIGLNGTRALTAFNSRNGGFNVTTAGRVQTPTLVILAEREKEIRAFKPESYWEVHADLAVSKGEFEGRWFQEEFKKSEEQPHARAERLWNKQEAEAIRDRCMGQTGIIEETKKPQKQSPPQLFDLTSLQREANGKFGFSAKRTLQLAQACYDRYKLLTYPRTDSKYLPEDYLATVNKVVKGFSKGKASESFPQELVDCSKWLISNKKIVPTKRIFNSSKVTDHFAIIPTGKMPPGKVDEAALKLYQLVLRRFLGIFYPHAEYELTRRITRIGQDSFLTTGKVLVVPGYLEVYGRKPGVAGAKDELVGVTDGESAKAEEVNTKEDETRPPARYNDSTLLSAMETAGKRVDDEELREAMSERGLGTPATRAAIIENLIRQKYLFRHEHNKRDLVTSNKGLALVDLLTDIGISDLGSPEMTGEWEYKLKQMEQGQLDRSAFMAEIKGMTKNIVEVTRSFTDEITSRAFPDLIATCPECGANEMRQTDGLFECKDPECIFKVKKHIASHELTEDQARDLINNKRVGPIETFKNRFGQPFTAELAIDKKKKVWKVEFIFEGDDLREEERKNLKEEQVICEAPLGDGSDEKVKVYETDRAFLAPQMATKADENGVRISKTILDKEIPLEQAIKLFVDGKTELMPGFRSKKGRRFAAHLTLDYKTGKLGFEFAPRKTKKKAAGEEGGEETENADGAKPETDDGDTQAKTAKKKTVKKKATKRKGAKKKTKATKKKSS